jgi:hypothetical protein
LKLNSRDGRKHHPKMQLKEGEEEEDDDDDDDEWVPPVLHSVEAAAAIQSQNCKLLLLYT